VSNKNDIIEVERLQYDIVTWN